MVLCYLNDRVNQKLLEEVREKLRNIQMRSLSMGQESVAETIRPKQWYNPFPKVRYTERPDTAAACVMEGYIILMVDNSPSVMILPTSFSISLRRPTSSTFRRWWEVTCACCGSLSF